jgi:hypothetical protein
MRKRVLTAGIVLAAVLSAAGLPSWAAPPRQARAVIKYPTEGMSLSGTVEITGYATHPNIAWFEVDYTPGPEATGSSEWVRLAFAESQQVEDGVLATWDTTTVPDGFYTLALTVKGRDDPFNYQQIVKRLAVNNAQPVLAPTSDQPTPESMPTAVVGATPTPVSIEQPATPTPRPSATPGGDGEEGVAPATSGGQGQSDLTLDTDQLGDRLRGAFCSGGLIVVMLFLLWGLYVLAKISIRWYARERPEPPWR